MEHKEKLNIKYSTIIKAIEKCLTNQRIREKLGELSEEEKAEKVKELSNPAEYELYKRLTSSIKSCEEHIEKLHNKINGGKFPIAFVESFKDSLKFEMNNLEKLKERVFKYEKRIFDSKYVKREPSVVDYDLSDYSEEEQQETVKAEIGSVERRLLNNNSSVTLSDANIYSLKRYYGQGSYILNSKLNNGRAWNMMPSSEREAKKGELKNMSRNLSNAIHKTKPLGEKVIVYRGGIFDVEKIVGDHIKFKGFTSTSLQKNVANTVGDWTYRIALNENTRAMMGNMEVDGEAISGYPIEHEILLDKGFEGDIADIDYENHLVTIIGV